MKLENMLVFTNSRRQYQAKLSDFSHSITDQHESAYLGTEGYRPPEVLALPDPLRYEQLLKCDIWAFGIAIYEMHLGTVPDEPEIDNKVSLYELLSRVKGADACLIAVPSRSSTHRAWMIRRRERSQGGPREKWDGRYRRRRR